MPSSVLRSVTQNSALRLIVRRVGHAIPVTFGVTLLTYSLMNLLPGGAATALAGEGASQEEINELAKKLNLNQPFVTRYLHWVGNAITGNLGKSLSSEQPVSTILALRVPVTLELVVISMILSVGLAIPVALLAARKPHSVADRISTVISMLGISIPGFVLGLILILLLAVKVHAFPSIGFVPLSRGLWPNLRTMLLPSITLAFALFCNYVRILRGDLTDQLYGEDYVVTARAKGLTARRILIHHTLRNSLFSLLTIVGINLGVLIGGTVIIEQIFALPGVGQQLILSIQNEDVVVVEGIVLVISLAVVVASIITDLLYAALDPRIRYGRVGS